MAQVCQHVTVDLEMILNPAKHEKDWRQILSVMLDFNDFKSKFT
jgi:hypothetical protein